MVYRVWDLESGNILADCATEAEALAAVRRAVEYYGPAGVKQWALEREDEDGAVTLLAQGDRLARLARGGVPT